jgi:uncharacterized Tic20 family protein
MEVINQSSSEERNWALFAHLSALAGYIIPFGHIIGPVIVWSIKKDEFPLVDANGKEAINFQISMTIYIIISVILIILLIGILLLIGLAVLNIVLIIVAAVKANAGEVYKYPLAIPFIK